MPTDDISPPPMARVLSALRIDELLHNVQQQLAEVVTTRDRVARLLDAVLAVASGLELDPILHRIVEAAIELVDAQYGALGVLTPTNGRFSQLVNIGIDAPTRAAMGPLPEGKGLLGQLIVDPRPLRLADLSTHRASVGFPANHPPMRTFLGVPIRVGTVVFGNLYLTEKAGGAEFTAADEVVVEALATAAGIALQNADLYEKAQLLAVFADRDRIARDLHDHVIQRLFATGLELQSTLRRITDEEARERVQQSVDDLDATIREIRTSIFDLHTAGEASESNLRQTLLDTVTMAVAGSGIVPSVRIAKAVNTLVPGEVGVHAVAVVREAVSNAVRHGRPNTLTITVQAGDGELVIDVLDDGMGIDPEQTRSGLRNLEERARQCGGKLSVKAEAEPAGGTRLVWRVPLN